jgi:hypothetical protein
VYSVACATVQGCGPHPVRRALHREPHKCAENARSRGCLYPPVQHSARNKDKAESEKGGQVLRYGCRHCTKFHILLLLPGHPQTLWRWGAISLLGAAQRTIDSWWCVWCVVCMVCMVCVVFVVCGVCGVYGVCGVSSV